MTGTTLLAITRAVPRSLAQCELTFLAREPIDCALAEAQHEAYEACLTRGGCRLVRLPAEPALPDSVFVEDTAVVLDEVAIITRPGAESRRPETRSMAELLSRHRATASIEAPGTLDGGDVLRVGRTVYVGRSARTNDAGIQQLQHLTQSLDYVVRPVQVRGCLHLKSAVTRVGLRALLLNPEWIDRLAFTGLDLIEVDPAEPAAANALWVGGRVLHPASYGRTRARLEARGVCVEAIDVSEILKAEGGVTCCSVIFEER